MIYLDILVDWLKAWGITALLLINFTWVYFTAVMRLRELKDAGKLAFKISPTLFVFAWINLIIGLVLDALVNLLVATVVLMEFPREIPRGRRAGREAAAK